jgi:predicted DNA binding CopG/RHH family protein
MYTEASKKATIKYMKKLKRIPLDVQPEQYDAIKQYAKSQGKPVNTAIKEIIFEKIGISS